MEYSKLIAVTGMSGLFELVSSKNDGAIVKGLKDTQAQFVSSRKHQFSHLESIEIYTQGENVNLVEVLQAMRASDKPLPDVKDLPAIKDYFAEVFPAMDFDRVYASDMKKMIKWHALLTEANIEPILRTRQDEDAASEDAPPAEEAS